MKKTIIALLTLACAAISYAEDLAIKLEAFKVVPATAERAEQLVQTEDAAPGEVIEYRAVYSNISPGMLRNLVPEIPIPAGLVAIEGTDVPKAASATVDSKTFVPLPVRDADGKPVPYAALRAFRWNVADLAAGQSVTLRIRATISR